MPLPPPAKVIVYCYTTRRFSAIGHPTRAGGPRSQDNCMIQRHPEALDDAHYSRALIRAR